MRAAIFSIIAIACVLSFHTPGLALKPSRTYFVVPDTLGLRYEKNVVTTADGVHLKSWTFLPADSIDNKTTLIVANGDAGNMSGFVTFASILSQVGYTVTLFDYRGFGESDDFNIDPQYLYYNEFIKDLSAVVANTRQKYPGHKTGIWAFSMGTIITTLLPAAAAPDFIIGDSYVVDMQEVRKLIEEKKKATVLLPPGADKYEAAVYQVKKPLLIFIGSQDAVTTSAPVMKLKEKLPATTVVSYDGGHMQGFQVLSKTFYGSEYISNINEFVKKLH